MPGTTLDPKPRLSAERLPDPGRPSERVLRDLRQWISEGVLPAGQSLPAERTLAEQLGTNRKTLRTALSVLDAEGVLRSNGGRIRTVTAPGPRSTSAMSDAIAVLTPLPEAPAPGHRTGGWNEVIGQGAISAIGEAGFHALALNPMRLDEAGMERLVQDHPRGVVLTDLSDSDLAKRLAGYLRSRGVQLAVYGDPPDFAECDCITSDHAEGAYQLTRWLIAKGRRRIVNVWPVGAEGYWFGYRQAGHIRAMQEAGLEALPPVRLPWPTRGYPEADFRASARQLAGAMLEEWGPKLPFDAIQLASDGHVCLAAAALRLFGAIPNEDVGITGYDNFFADSIYRAFEPTWPLATVDKLNDHMGRSLVELLLERAAGRLPEGPRHLVIAPRLVVVGGETDGRSQKEFDS